MAGSLTVDILNGYDVSGGFLGIGQTWQYVTASRVLGTTYTNTSGKPIQISVTLYATANNSSPVVNLLIGGVVSQIGGSYGAHTYCYMSMIIPSGVTYSVTSTGTGGYTLTKWYELR